MVLAIIPARYDSGRLPGKALADIGGKPMVVRVWERARRAEGVDEVWVATDDDRIAAAVEAEGGAVARTGPCASGTDRVAAALGRRRGVRVVVNVQGDEPLIDPRTITAVAAEVARGAAIATAAAPYAGDPADPARVKVVVDRRGRALYFSRQAVPLRGPWLLHVGLYAFRPAALRRVAALDRSTLEESEGLEQLRWLEAGARVQVVPVPAPHPSVDTPADLERVRALWAAASSPRSP